MGIGQVGSNVSVTMYFCNCKSAYTYYSVYKPEIFRTVFQAFIGCHVHVRGPIVARLVDQVEQLAENDGYIRLQETEKSCRALS